jgi:hypothetical protein
MNKATINSVKYLFKLIDMSHFVILFLLHSFASLLSSLPSVFLWRAGSSRLTDAQFSNVPERILSSQDDFSRLAFWRLNLHYPT